MRYLLFSLLALPLLAADLPQPVKDQPLYQKRWGGTVIAWPFGNVDEVAWPKPESIEEAELRIEIERLEQEMADERALKKSGHRQMKYGALALVVGILAAVVLAHYGFELVGVIIAGLGLAGIMSGAITIKLADHITGVAVGAVGLGLIGIIAIFAHGQGFKFGPTLDSLKKKVKEKL